MISPILTAAFIAGRRGLTALHIAPPSHPGSAASAGKRPVAPLPSAKIHSGTDRHGCSAPLLPGHPARNPTCTWGLWPPICTTKSGQRRLLRHRSAARTPPGLALRDQSVLPGHLSAPVVDGPASHPYWLVLFYVQTCQTADAAPWKLALGGGHCGARNRYWREPAG